MQRQVRGRSIGDTNTMPQAEVEHGSAHNCGAGNIFLVSRQENAAGRRPCPILGEDQLLGLEGVPNVLGIDGRATVKHLIQTAIPLLDFMRWRLVGFRQGTQAVEQTSRTAGRAANAEKIEQRARRFPVEQPMDERLHVDQGFRLGCPAHQVRWELDHVARVGQAGFGPQLQQPIRQQRLRRDRSCRSRGRYLRQTSASGARPIGIALI